MRPLIGQWGAPPDLAAWIALAAGVALWAWTFRRKAEAPAPSPWLLALAAGALSWLYWRRYLHGTPRVIDATTYWLQARALAEGHFTWEIPEVSASFRGRFLLFNEVTGRVGGIFPPGYPLVLALGFAAGVPWLVGPLLAVALTWMTGALTREMFHDHPAREAMRRWAMAVSLACAAVRYHTADTLSHGAAALALTCAFMWALRASRTGAGWLRVGVAVGWLCAIRPVSVVAALGVCLALARRPRAAGVLLLGMAPGVLFFLVEQRAVTGRWFTSTQTAYYAQSDGPRGCFRYGFGHGVGCRFEHGEFLDGYAFGDGYGTRAALGVTLRRLRAHALDVANFEVLALLAVFGAWRWRARRSVRGACALVVGHFVAYAPFYFDGNIAGGGARLYADVLPLEHALLVAGLGAWGDEGSRRAARLAGVMAASFALHAVFEHRVAGEKIVGVPRVEPGRRALVFVTGDHAFNLAHRPGERDAVVARGRGDAHDAVLYERLRRPPAFRFMSDARGGRLVAWRPALGDELVFEADREWPARSQRGGYAVPARIEAPCVTGGSALRLVSEGRLASAEVELPLPRSGDLEVVPFVFAEGDGRVTILEEEGRVPLTTWAWNSERGCIELPSRHVKSRSPRLLVRIETTCAPLSLDRVVVSMR